MFILAQRGPEGNPKGIKRKPKGKDEEMMTERRKRREWTLLAVVVLFWFAQYVYIPYQTPFLTGKGVAAGMIGTVVGAYGVTQMIFRLPVGVMADWAGRHRIFVSAGAALAALAYFDRAKANDYIEIYSDDEDDVF